MARQFDVCVECRRCVSLCGVFPLAFDQILATPQGEAGLCTPYQQDLVADRCTFCGLCRADCPHDAAPESVDIVELMARMQVMRRRRGLIGGRPLARKVRRLMSRSWRARSAATHCLGGVYHDQDRLGCCGAGALFAGDLDGARAARAELDARVVAADVAPVTLSVEDPRCRCELDRNRSV